MVPTKKTTAKTAKKPVKRLSLANERQSALHEIQRYCVEKEMTPNGFNVCITCGNIIDNAQGGHFISRRYKATELEEDNIHPQCPYCNQYREGDPLKYRANLMDLYGPAYVERLENMRFASEGSQEAMSQLSQEDLYKALHAKKTAKEYQAIKLKYRALRKELKRERGY